jgi:hypothetical protein
MTLFVFFAFSRVTGTEFSPQTFFKREFTYYRVPVFKFPLSATYIETGTLACPTDISKYLKSGASSLGPVRWDLADSTFGTSPNDPGEASILLEYLELQDVQRASYWGDWSTKHADRAAVLWPLVQQFAIHRCYFAIPELMQAAEAADSLEAFQGEAARIVHRAASRKARYWIAQGDKATAMSIVTWAAEFPDLERVLEPVQAELAD